MYKVREKTMTAQKGKIREMCHGFSIDGPYNIQLDLRDSRYISIYPSIGFSYAQVPGKSDFRNFDKNLNLRG